MNACFWNSEQNILKVSFSELLSEQYKPQEKISIIPSWLEHGLRSQTASAMSW